MLILHGIHHFGQRRIGCRADFCNACEREVFTEQVQSFDCWHIFFIPLIPLGTRRRWICANCHDDPRARHRTSRFVKILGIFILALISATLWAVPISETPADDQGIFWGMRFLFPALFLLSSYFVFFRKDNGDLLNSERRSRVTPLNSESCPYCGDTLQQNPETHCPACHVQVHTTV